MQNSRVISVAESNQQFKIDVKSVSKKSLRCLKLIFTYYTFYVIQMLQTAGIDCQSVFLIVEDHVLKYKFLHDTLNNLISTGEAIDLYTTTELETIVAPLRDQLEQDGFEGSLINYFNKSKYNSDLEHLNDLLDVQFYSCSQWASMKCVFFFTKIGVREHLHIIITLDIARNDYKQFHEDYPQLVKNCSTVWIDSWSDITMQDMPHLLINT